MKNRKTIKVWDPFIRVFHWSLVIAFTAAYVTEEDFLSIHTVAGYVLLGLLGLRMIWGFIGTRHARFSDFTFSLSSIRDFLIDTLHFRARRYLGRNPAGGAMIYLMIVSLLITSISGLAVYAVAEQAGPLAGIITATSSVLEDVLEETHEFFANFTLFLIFIHVAGVIVESFIHRENLVNSMITGYKREINSPE